MTTYQVLAAAKDLILRRGLARGRHVAPDGSVCASGALMLAGEIPIVGLVAHPTYAALLHAMEEVDPRGWDKADSQRRLIPAWSDSHSQEQVLAAFDLAMEQV